MKFNKYIASAFTAVTMLFASSCTDSVEYEPTPGYEGDGVYFSQESVTDIALTTDATQVAIYINRVKTAGELTVDLASTIVDADGLPVAGVFTVPAQVTFADGENIVPVNIAVAFDNVVPGEDYFVNIKTDTETSAYGSTEITYTISYSPWQDPILDPAYGREPCTATYSYPFNGSVSFQQLLYVQNNITNENLKRYVVPTPSANAIPFDFYFDIDYINPVEIDGDQCYYIHTPSIPFYDADPEGQFTLIDSYSWVKQYCIVRGIDPTEDNIHRLMSNNGWSDSYFNTRTGIAYIDMVAYPAAMEWGYMYNNFASFVYTVEFPGYVNYAFNYSIQGNFVDVTGAESVLVQVFKSNNMAYFSAIAKSGALDDAGIEAAAAELASDNNKTFYSESGTTISVPVTDEGMYTLVTVGYDEGYSAVYTQAYTFEFKTVQAASDWEDFGEAEYTDGIICSLFDVDPVMYPVKVQRHKETPGLYRLVNPYAEWGSYTNTMTIMAPGNYYLTLDCSNPNYVNILESDLGISLGDQFGYFSITSQANLIYEAGNATIEQLREAGYYGTLENGEITFPAGCIIAALSNMYNGQWNFYVNLDPNNPTAVEGYEGEFNPYLGEGLFHVSIDNLVPGNAPAKHSAPVRSGELKSVGGLKQTKYANFGSSLRKVRALNTEELKKRTQFNIGRIEL